MAVVPTGFGKSIIYQSFVVEKNVTSAFQLFCPTFLIALRVLSSSMCFTLVSEEKLRFSTTSKISAAERGSDQCLGSEFLRISSLYSGPIAMGTSLDFPQLFGDLSILAFARFLLSFSFLLPIQETLQVFKPQDSGILIFLVKYVAVFVCCDEILLRYVVVFSDEIQSFCSISYFQCALRANTRINKVQNLNEI